MENIKFVVTILGALLGTFLGGIDGFIYALIIKKWLETYAEKELAPSTLHPYKGRLNNRIIPALGHIKLAKLQPHHFMDFYSNLAEGGIRLDPYYVPTEAFMGTMKEGDTAKIHELIGIDRKTYVRVINGERAKLEVVQKFCEYFKTNINKCFYLEDKNKKLSNKTIKHHHDLISSILSTAVDWNLIASNPAEKAWGSKRKSSGSKNIKKLNDYYDDIQVVNLFAAIENEPLKYKRLYVLL